MRLGSPANGIVTGQGRRGVSWESTGISVQRVAGFK